MYLSLYRCVNDRPQFGYSHNHSVTDAVCFRTGNGLAGMLCNPSRRNSPALALGDRLEISFADVETNLEEPLMGSVINWSISSGISNY